LETGGKLEDLFLENHRYSWLENTQPVSSNVIAMPWFRKGKKKHRITKKDISEPTEFKHCFHAVLDASSSELEGLPPQWSEIVESQQQNVNAVSASEKSKPDVVSGGIKPRPDTPHHSDFSNTEKDGPVNDSDVFSPSEDVENCNILDQSSKNAKLSSTSNRNSKISTTDSLKESAINLKENNAKNLSSSSKHSQASTTNNSSQSLAKRPSPVVRDSDASIEDTIRCIRKQSQHRSDENFPEEALNRSITGGDAVVKARSHGRSRAGSFMQLRTSPVVRKHVVS